MILWDFMPWFSFFRKTTISATKSYKKRFPEYEAVTFFISNETKNLQKILLSKENYEKKD